jgi:hypothetical protein
VFDESDDNITSTHVCIPELHAPRFLDAGEVWTCVCGQFWQKVISRRAIPTPLGATGALQVVFPRWERVMVP